MNHLFQKVSFILACYIFMIYMFSHESKNLILFMIFTDDTVVKFSHFFFHLVHLFSTFTHKWFIFTFPFSDMIYHMNSFSHTIRQYSHNVTFFLSSTTWVVSGHGMIECTFTCFSHAITYYFLAPPLEEVQKSKWTY